MDPDQEGHASSATGIVRVREVQGILVDSGLHSHLGRITHSSLNRLRHNFGGLAVLGRQLNFRRARRIINNFTGSIDLESELAVLENGSGAGLSSLEDSVSS